MEKVQGHLSSSSSSFLSASSSSSLSKPHSLSVGPECWMMAEQSIQEILFSVQPTVASERRREDIIDYFGRLFKRHFGIEKNRSNKQRHLGGRRKNAESTGGLSVKSPPKTIPSETETGGGDNSCSIMSLEDFPFLQGSKMPIPPPTFPSGGLDESQRTQESSYLSSQESSMLLVSGFQVAPDPTLRASTTATEGASESPDNHKARVPEQLYKLEDAEDFPSLPSMSFKARSYSYYHAEHEFATGICEILEGEDQNDTGERCPTHSCTVEAPENDGSELLLTAEFLKNILHSVILPTGGAETKVASFLVKFLNLMDPLKGDNNLGRSVRQGNFIWIKNAFRLGTRELKAILALPQEQVGEGVNKFFSTTLNYNGNEQTSEVQIPTSVFDSEGAEVFDLSGDYDSYFSNLQIAQLVQNCTQLSSAALVVNGMANFHQAPAYIPLVNVEKKSNVSCRGTGTFIPEITVREIVKPRPKAIYREKQKSQGTSSNPPDAVDQLIGKDHLFKRSIILVKAWCHYESRILGAQYGLMSTYAVEILVLYIINRSHSSLHSPLAVLYSFLDYYGSFDWDKYGISTTGPFPISFHADVTSQLHLTVEAPENDGSELLLTAEFLKNIIHSLRRPTRGPETNVLSFPVKFLNVMDPLKGDNNLGRSVGRGSFSRIKLAFRLGTEKLKEVLALPQEQVGEGVKKFFSTTLKYNGKGQSSDVQVPSSVFDSEGAEVFGFSGDYDSYFSNLQIARLVQNGTQLCSAALGVNGMADFHQAPAYIPQVNVEKKSNVSCRGTGTLIPEITVADIMRPQPKAIYREKQKSQGTSSSPPDVKNRSNKQRHLGGRRKNAESTRGLSVKSPPKTVPSETETGGGDNSCSNMSLEDFPFLPGSEMPIPPPTLPSGVLNESQLMQELSYLSSQESSMLLVSGFQVAPDPTLHTSTTATEGASESPDNHKARVPENLYKLEDVEDFPPLRSMSFKARRYR